MENLVNYPSCHRLLYAIGDIHGRADLLQLLLATIAADINLSDHDGGPPVIVFLGDYVDRGLSSRAVVDCILELCQRTDLEIRALKGNHEQALLLFLDDASFGRTWLVHGGAATLISYGVQPPNPRATLEEFEQARLAFRRALGSSQLEFFKSLQLYTVQDDYAFVHAGVRWGLPLHEQAEEDLLWIRNDFLQPDATMDRVVVHGHTPLSEPYLGVGRIGIDTGAYATGVLTAIRLWNSSQTVIQSR